MSYFLKRMGRGDTFYLDPDKEKILIGRSPQCDISFSSVHISRQHCQILRSPPNGALVIKNIRDTNCTYVEELKLQNPESCAELQVGCRIGLGVPLNLATENGVHNNNFVFLKLEGPQSSLLTRRNEARTIEDTRNIEAGVHSQSGQPQRATTPSDYPPEAACVKDVARTCLLSRHSSQEQRVPTEGLRPHCISSNEDLNSVPDVSQPPVSIQNGMRGASHCTTSSDDLRLKERLQQNTTGSKFGGGEEGNYTRQSGRAAVDSHIVKPNIAADENFVAPIQALDSSLKSKQTCSTEDLPDLSFNRKVSDQKNEASRSKKVTNQQTSICDISSPSLESATSFPIEEPGSPMNIDLTQGDPDSPVRTHSASDTFKKEQLKESIACNLISLATSDVEIVSSPEKLPHGKGKELSGKRKRPSYDEPPSEASEAQGAKGASIKKKVKSSSLLHGSRDTVSAGEGVLSNKTYLNTNMSDPTDAPQASSDSGNEPVFLKITNHQSNRSDVNNSSEDSDNISEPLFDLESSQKAAKSLQTKSVGESDSSSDLLFCKKKVKQNLNKHRSKKPAKKCNSEGELLVSMQATKQNLKECNLQRTLMDSDSDSDSLFFKRKFNQDASQCDVSKASTDSSSDSEPLLPKRKPGNNPLLICSSDDDLDIQVSAPKAKSKTGKSVKKLDKGSCFSVNTKTCKVNLNRLPSYVSKDMPVVVTGNSLSSDCSASSSTKVKEAVGDATSISDSERSKSSKNYQCDYKRKRKPDDESKVSHKSSEGIMQEHATTEQQMNSRMQNESFGEHSSHSTIDNTTRADKRKGTDAPPLNEGNSSIPSVSCIGEQTNKVPEMNKLSIKSEPMDKDDGKPVIKEPSKNTVEITTEIKIKTEPGVACEENISTENDDVVFMYSQAGDEIWISSDEEEAPPPPGHASTSLDEELDFLFPEEDEQKTSSAEPCSFPEKTLPEVDDSEIDNHGRNDDDQWFPVLSQSFLENSDEEDNKDEECIQESKDTSITIDDEPIPGPSGLCEPLPDNEEDEADEWWPILSQGFFDDEPEAEEKENEDEPSISNNNKLETEANSEANSSGGTPSDLQSVIDKLKKKSRRTSQLTEAKIPLPSSRKSKSKRSNEIQMNDLKISEPSVTVKEKDDRGIQKNMHSATRYTDFKHVKKMSSRNNKSQNLRKTLTCKFNLESYKSTIECRTKEKHHLVGKNSGKPSGPSPSSSSSMRPVQSKKSENISIQKRAKPEDLTSQDKAPTTVAAKVTKKTRNEKLIDCDIFSKPSKGPVTSKSNKYKIPKSSGPKTSDISSVHSEVQGRGSVLATRKHLKAAGNSGEHMLLDTAAPQPGTSSENTYSKTLTTSQSASVRKGKHISEKIDDISKDLQSVKLKSKPKRVHFPDKHEDLVKVLLISPRKKGERAGIPSVRARETLPEELMLQRRNIPPYYMELFIHHVCHWNYDWLECYHTAQEKHRAGALKTIPAPPPVVSSTNYPTLILYSSYNDYKETHSSLFYLELWERIYRDWTQARNRNYNLQALIEFVKPVLTKTSSGVLRFWAVKLTVAMPQTRNINLQDFRQGTLLSLKVRKEAKKSIIFGYIDHVMANNRQMAFPSQKQGPVQMSPSFSLGVRVTKNAVETIKPGTVITINYVSYIRPSSRVWESLCKLPLFPLCKDILTPSLEAFSSERETEYMIKNLPLNEVQEKAVTTVSSKCMYESHIPKLSLIHGPPGTGKTSTIVALVAQMVMMGRSSVQGCIPQCRILLCAPSNAAVDELTLRLIRLRDIGLSLRVVRVGFKVSDHPLVRNCTLDQFVNRQIKMEISTPRCESAKQEWQRKKILVQQIAEELEKARKEGRHNEIRQLEGRLNEMARAKSEFEKRVMNEPSARERYELQQKWQQEFLLQAEVVTTTLNSCVSGVMGEVLSKHHYHFTCCIVDEAGQCQETETLLPLLLGIRKLVLVGDHHQLPATVLSQLASSKNLKQSLFERLHHRLVLELQQEDAVHTLNMQYRMHPEIVEWPASHFYMKKLTTCPMLVSQSNTNLKPYIIFDLKNSQEQRHQNQEMYNPAEASLVYVLLEVLQPHLSHKTVGIITPYQRQRIYLEEKLAKFKGKINISINTIDGFQGQERDVIILSFVRANNAANIGFLSHRQRLNVALTRAKKICYIVASLSSLEGNKEWNSLIRNGRMRGLVYPVTSKEENDKSFLRSVVEKRGR